MSDLQTINVTVPIPETHIIISKIEYQDLIDNQPMNMTLTEVANYYNYSIPWITKHIITEPYFRRKIEPFSTFVSRNGGGKYSFNRKKMKEFLNEYDEEIKKRAKRNF
ncbi:DUF771 domain-containing protein [Staphylococcus gallinarum]|uniref:DUF771 domain-containing protein n=1 Tax=Staphylococcus gallinarum TaxID=1293 RepID=UPI000D1E4C5D|nr:DUF771 domain-containing protein [Staphylococcus gallinarum]PTK92438.1 DUF771 domain-containing protein [Staphylococcus gallinarum]PTL09364.1 DUF771 domain-containing protein [Staphylococcus gallinarum]RIL23729.1 DUF771 domain-containing protein [Staphylococcus gallinarum]RIL24699.1 DUF771 domain-containing protein [Staphylococcus gallinarum]RIL28918.1 DUF771 domain-containing protein [Staphylococcus gallinarum]